MPKRELIFWTTPELNKAKKCLLKNNNNVAATARELTTVMNRTEQALGFKLYQIKNIANPIAGRKVREIRKDRPQGALDLPKGFSFDFTPKRAEMFQDHIRLYF